MALKSSFFSYKGGTGKTTLTYIFGRYLSSKNKKTLLIDLDPQCDLSRCFLYQHEMKNSVKDLFIPDTEIIPTVVEENLHVLQGDAVLDLTEEAYFEDFYNNMIQLNQKYEYILFDTRPALNSWQVLFPLGVCDKVVHVENIIFSDDTKTKYIEEVLEDNDIEIDHILYNNIRTNTMYSKIFEEITNKDNRVIKDYITGRMVMCHTLYNKCDLFQDYPMERKLQDKVKKVSKVIFEV